MADRMDAIIPGIGSDPLDIAMDRAAQALTASRMRGIEGHWTYDRSRHVALKQLVRALEIRAAQQKEQAA